MKNRLQNFAGRKHRKNCRAFSRRAFSLVELLAVLLIVSVLMGLGAQVMKNATTAQGIETGVPLAEGVFAQARAMAKGSGAGARVVIYSGGGKGEDREKHLRYMGVVRQIVDDKGTADTTDDTLRWNDKLAGRGVMLPSKVYFNDHLSGNVPETDVQIPGMKGLKNCYYYEFNGEGVLVNPKNANEDAPTAVFVIQAGTLLPTDDTPRPLTKKNREAGGFAIWKRGNTTLFRSVNEIPGLTDNEMPKFK